MIAVIENIGELQDNMPLRESNMTSQVPDYH